MDRLFTLALTDKDMGYIDKVPSILFTEEEKEWRKWIKAYTGTYSELPTAERLQTEYSDFNPIHVHTKRGILERVLSERRQLKLNQFIMDSSGMAEEELKGEIAKLSIEINAAPTNVMSVKELNGFTFRKPEDGMHLCSNLVTEQHRGVFPGEVITLVGASGVGKSLLAMNTSIHWLLDGLNVLLVAADMKPEMTMIRAHSMLMKTNTEHMHKVPLVARKSFANLLNHLEGSLHIPNIAPRNVAEISSLVTEHSIDALVVDGTYFLQASFGKNGLSRGWENMSIVSNELKDLAHKTNIPVLSVSQTNREGVVAYSSSLEQDSDIVLIAKHETIFQAEGAKMLKVITHKNRRGNRYYANLQINYDTMTITDKSGGLIIGETDG